MVLRRDPLASDRTGSSAIDSFYSNGRRPFLDARATCFQRVKHTVAPRLCLLRAPGVTGAIFGSIGRTRAGLMTPSAIAIVIERNAPDYCGDIK